MPLVSFNIPWCFQAVSKETSGMKWIKEFDHCLLLEVYSEVLQN